MKIIQRYKELKEEYPNSVILFRKNHTYEAYEDDALTCAKELKVPVIVNRIIGSENYEIKSISFSHDELYVNLLKLLRAEHRIAFAQ